MLEIPQSYYENEVREGFEITSMVKRVWACQMDLVQVMDQICRKHHIKYFADWGTLLGAVRHKGYIPWDDDMDFAMLRPDYMRFIEACKKELPKGMWLNSPYTNENFDFTFCCLKDSTAMNFDEDYLKSHHGFPFIAGVDIFPIDELPKDKEEWDIYTMLLQTISVAFKDAGRMGAHTYEHLDLIEECTKRKIDRSGNIAKQLVMLLEDVRQAYAGEGGLWFESTEWVTNQSLYFERDAFDKLRKVPFEMIEVPIPEKYHHILQVEYGDYMTPVRGTQFHEYPYFCKQVNIVNEMYEEGGIKQLITLEGGINVQAFQEYKYVQELEETIRKNRGQLDQCYREIQEFLGNPKEGRLHPELLDSCRLDKKIAEFQLAYTLMEREQAAGSDRFLLDNFSSVEELDEFLCGMKQLIWRGEFLTDACVEELAGMADMLSEITFAGLMRAYATDATALARRVVPVLVANQRLSHAQVLLDVLEA